MKTPAIDRFAAQVEIADNGCWIWNGSLYQGYGSFTTAISRSAHQFSYQYFIGPVPEGLEIDHLCRNRRCCNPEHLEAVTHHVNMQRSPYFRGNKTKCPRGVAYPATSETFAPCGGCTHGEECGGVAAVVQQQHAHIQHWRAFGQAVWESQRQREIGATLAIKPTLIKTDQPRRQADRELWAICQTELARLAAE